MKKNFVRKKNKKKILAEKNIEIFTELIDKKFNKDYEKNYIKNIFEIQKSFNIKFSREFKLKFCKKCFSYKPYKIRIDKLHKTKNFICKNCGNIKRFKL